MLHNRPSKGGFLSALEIWFYPHCGNKLTIPLLTRRLMLALPGHQGIMSLELHLLKVQAFSSNMVFKVTFWLHIEWILATPITGSLSSKGTCSRQTPFRHSSRNMIFMVLAPRLVLPISSHGQASPISSKVLWPQCGWQPVSLMDLITGAAVKKVYRKATLCIHPDKVQQKGATLQQKYIAEKVFDLLK
ncbi:unnamed protein product, partial [Thlaspi arvense]